jgi:hypothetical protein
MGRVDIVLPPLSLNKITLKAPVEYAVKFESPLNGAKWIWAPISLLKQVQEAQ